MAAPVKPEVPQSGNGGTPIPTQAELESRRTQETQQQRDQSTRAGENVDTTQQPKKEELSDEKRLIAAQEAALRDQHRLINDLQSRVRSIDERTRPAEPTPPSEADMNNDFWKNPVGTISALITQELKKTVAPINEQLSRTVQSAQMSELDKAKVALKAEYGDDWEKIAPTLDEYIQNNQGKAEITPQLLELAALTAIGAYHRGKLQVNGVPVLPTTRQADNPTPPEEKRVTQAPPHLRPSAPNAPSQDQKGKQEVRQLTENEARLARERKMSPEQFLEWMNTPPENVIHSKIGREEPPK